MSVRISQQDVAPFTEESGRATEEGSVSSREELSASLRTDDLHRAMLKISVADSRTQRRLLLVCKLFRIGWEVWKSAC